MNNSTEILQLFEEASDQYKQLTCLKGLVIVLEGIIGAGKSLKGRSLNKFLTKNNIESKYFKEPTEKELLDLFLKYLKIMNDPERNELDKQEANVLMKKYAYTYQIAMLIKRKNLYKDAIKYSKTGGISIIDRGILGDVSFCTMLKEDGFINDEEYKVYLNMLTSDKSLEPHLTLFLKVSPKKAFERMKKRGNKNEIKSYTLQYFENLNNHYLKIMKKVKHPIIYHNHENDQISDENGLLNDEYCFNICMLIKEKIHGIPFSNP